MSGFTGVHISGDLGQALVSTATETWLFEGDTRRRLGQNDLALFFAYGLEIMEIPQSQLNELSEKDLVRRLKDETDRFAALRSLLLAMDPELSKDLRVRALNRTNSLLQNAQIKTFTERRVLRSTDLHDWDLKAALKWANLDRLSQVVDILRIIESGYPRSVEDAIKSWARFNQRDEEIIVDMAREADLVANVARALYANDLTGFRRATLGRHGDTFGGLTVYLNSRFSSSLERERVFAQRSTGPIGYHQFTSSEEDRVRALIGYDEDYEPATYANILEASLYAAKQPLFFVADARSRSPQRARYYFNLMYEEPQLSRRGLPSRKQWENLLGGRAMSLAAILKVDAAIQELAGLRQDFGPRRREYSELFDLLPASCVVPSVFWADPRELAEFRTRILGASQIDLSRLAFGQTARNSWAILERYDGRGVSMVTRATVQKMAALVDPRLEDIFRLDPLTEFGRWPSSGRSAYALGPEFGNVVASNWTGKR